MALSVYSLRARSRSLDLVDDFKKAGPKEHCRKDWELLRQGLDIEPESPLGLRLGCNGAKGEPKPPMALKRPL